ncbi:50S ribosomal protein L13 [Halostella sp. PRR32]|uniref:50S ribosomal protein L13 n=1 Tax=Halostella sp. PRR32 TaxID=3098147 RepID=UPI00110D9403|nr:50S ribosomal protein L13 [Halostella sp. PRR32]
MSIAEFEADVAVDARDCILGRVASQVAEKALNGERVAVINAEDAVITGDEDDIMSKYRKRRELGSDSGPYYPKRPDEILKRSIRGMLPYKKKRGREAFENVRVYVGNPHDRDGEILDGTSLDRLSNIRFVHLGEVSNELGANVTW